MSLLEALKNKINPKIKYKAPAEKLQSTLSDAQLRALKNKRTTSTNSIPQYGDKNYTPSTGIGVSY